jgi:uncharacterized membrane protein (DUF2068 family)
VISAVINVFSFVYVFSFVFQRISCLSSLYFHVLSCCRCWLLKRVGDYFTCAVAGCWLLKRVGDYFTCRCWLLKRVGDYFTCAVAGCWLLKRVGDYFTCGVAWLFQLLEMSWLVKHRPSN